MKYEEITTLKKEHKLINKQGFCPRCKQPWLNYGAVEFEDDMCYFPWHCDNCGLEGEEWYSLEFNGHNVVNENGEQIEL